MGGEPGAAHVPVGPHGVACVEADGTGHGPDVGVMGEAPAATDAVVGLGGELAGALQLLHEGEERLVHLGQGCRLCGPVVLLDIDVAGVVARPGREDGLVPESLQVGGHVGRARTADEKVAPVLKVEGLELGVEAALVEVVAELDVGGDRPLPGLPCRGGAVTGGCEGEFDAVVERLVVVDMTVPELGVRDGGEVAQAGVGQLAVCPTLLHGVAVVAVEGGGIDDVERHLAGAVDDDGIALGPDVAGTLAGKHVAGGAHAAGLDQHLGAEVDAALRIVGELLLGLVVAGQRGVAGIAVGDEGVAVLGAAAVAQLATEREARVDAPGVVGGDLDDDAGVGVCGEIVGGIERGAAVVERAGRGVADVEPTAIAGDGLGGVKILNGELSQGLVVLREMALHVALQAVGPAVVAAAERLADGRNGLVGLGRIDLHVAGFAGPQRDVVERDTVAVGAAVDDAAHGAVADDQRLLEVVRRPVIMQNL